jgi:hypothetical protein
MSNYKCIKTVEEYIETLNQKRKDFFVWIGDCDVEEEQLKNGKVLLKIKKKCAKNDGKTV